MLASEVLADVDRLFTAESLNEVLVLALTEASEADLLVLIESSEPELLAELKSEVLAEIELLFEVTSLSDLLALSDLLVEILASLLSMSFVLLLDNEVLTEVLALLAAESLSLELVDAD
ncbi:hypothetical protein [Fructilactobacillus frigidiflavus]|uniref:hypothetical protein n=1 Tax=Fructilactobacillus frigidiflavus TaxID=3242688 RepID=UPI003757E7F0